MTDSSTATLTCPKCQGAMRSYERNGVTIDQCQECRGVFLDRGELDRLIDAEEQRYAPPPSTERRRDRDDDDRWRGVTATPSTGRAPGTSASAAASSASCSTEPMRPFTTLSRRPGDGLALEPGGVDRAGGADVARGLATVTVAAFDKTGTLTHGRPELVEMIYAPGVDDRESLALAGGLERVSEDRDVAQAEVADVRALIGAGVEGRSDGRVLCWSSVRRSRWWSASSH